MPTLTTLRAHRRIDHLEAELDELRDLLQLVAVAAGIDLDQAVLVDRAARRIWVATWQEMAAAGYDPHTGRSVAS